VVNRCLVIASSNDPCRSRSTRRIAAGCASGLTCPGWTRRRRPHVGLVRGWRLRSLRRLVVPPGRVRVQPRRRPARDRVQVKPDRQWPVTRRVYPLRDDTGPEGPFEQGVITAPFHVLCADLTLRAGLAPGQRIPAAALKEAGWQDMGRLGAVGLSTKKHVFAAPDMLHLSKSSGAWSKPRRRRYCPASEIGPEIFYKSNTIASRTRTSSTPSAIMLARLRAPIGHVDHDHREGFRPASIAAL
jgi:hypothetical protein